MSTICEARFNVLDRQHNGRAWLAWNTAAMTKARRLPRLQSLLVKKQRRRKRQTVEEQRKSMRMIAATFGGRK